MKYTEEERQNIIFRLTALWALNESGLGGFLHAFNFPFTGLIVGGIAVALITFIIYFSEYKRSVLFNSFIIVLLIKLIISPHSNVTAYFAVAFQVCCAFVIYYLMRINLASIILVCFLTFIESASQKIITLTIIGGISFWNALDVLVENVFRQYADLSISNASFWLLGFYYSIYITFSLITAFLIHSLFDQLSNLGLYKKDTYTLMEYEQEFETKKRKPPNPLLRWFLYSCIVLFVILTFFVFEYEEKGNYFVVFYILRTLSVVLFWYFILLPWVMKFVRKYLNGKLPQYQTEVEEIISLFPKLKTIVFYAWMQSRNFSGWRRINKFFTITLIELLTYK